MRAAQLLALSFTIDSSFVPPLLVDDWLSVSQVSGPDRGWAGS